MRIDSHLHFWRYDAAEYGWIDGSMATLRRDFLPSEARREMERARVDECIAVQARQTLEETRWLRWECRAMLNLHAGELA